MKELAIPEREQMAEIVADVRNRKFGQPYYRTSTQGKASDLTVYFHSPFTQVASMVLSMCSDTRRRTTPPWP
eukprot:6202828-Pleurochrysis_carterae.AAC.4